VECAAVGKVANMGLIFKYYSAGLHYDEILVTLGGLHMGRNFKVSFGRATREAMERGIWLPTQQFVRNTRKTTGNLYRAGQVAEPSKSVSAAFKYANWIGSPTCAAALSLKRTNALHTFSCLFLRMNYK
jgi:hypothetical protein